MRRAALLAGLLLLFMASFALAHGGKYQAGGGRTPGGHQIPPDVADRSNGSRTWESWWTAYRHQHLHLAERVRKIGRAATTGDGALSGTDLRILRETLVREQLVPLFLKALQDDDAEIRASAAIALGKTRDPQGTAPLVAAARKDKDDTVRASCVIALGIAGDERALPFLDELLCDGKENVRRRAFAAMSMGLVGGDDAAAGLVRFCVERLPRWQSGQREKERLAASAYVGLGLTGSPLALPVLRGTLLDGKAEDQIRGHAALALGQVRDREALPAILAILEKPGNRAPFRAAAAIALRDLVRADDAGALTVLIGVMHDDNDAFVREQATLTLAGVRTEGVRQALRKRLNAASDAERPGVALALAIAADATSAPRIRKLAEKERSAQACSAYALALGLLADEPAVPFLLGQLTPDPPNASVPLQSNAALALALMDCRPARDPVFELMKGTKSPTIAMNAAVALALLEDRRSQTTLLRWLTEDGSVRQRAGAAVTLGMLRAVEAAPRLIQVFENDRTDSTIRAFALVGLGFLGDPSEVPRLSRLATHGGYALPLEPLDELLSIL